MASITFEGNFETLEKMFNDFVQPDVSIKSIKFDSASSNTEHFKLTVFYERISQRENKASYGDNYCAPGSSSWPDTGMGHVGGGGGSGASPNHTRSTHTHS